MKKHCLVLASLFVLGCVSLSRNPASLNLSKFTFNLDGGAAPQREYQFDLLDLSALSKSEVKFRHFQFSDPQSSKEVSAWQSDFQKLTLERSKEGFEFTFKKTSISVEKKELENVIAILSALDATETDSRSLLRKKIEVISALNERFRSPVENEIEVLTAPFMLLSRLAYPTVPVQEAPRIEVPASSFWQPRSSQSVDMWNGAGRIDFGKLNQQVCEYRGPKTGFGVHAGFKIKCGSEKLKMKFGNEAYSGPFNSRIYHRLGFNVPAIHHVRHMQIRYDRRIFTEINSRKQQYFPLKIAGKEVTDFSRYPVFDAMSFVESARLKNGVVVSGPDLKKSLLPSCQEALCDYSASKVNSSFEDQIDVLIMAPGSVTEEIGEEIGPWNYATLDHPQRTEIKSLLLLGAWNGNFDLRKDNTRLVWSKETGELKHFISDPGSGFGNQTNPFFGKKGLDELKWNMTIDTKEVQGDTLVPVVSVTFRGLVDHEAFRRLSYAEAQWMTRMIASISEDEISEALAASGLSAAEFLLTREKLVSVQQDYIRAFGLKEEFSHRMRKINKHLNFDPEKDHVKLRLHNGSTYELENRGIRLNDGKLDFPGV